MNDPSSTLVQEKDRNGKMKEVIQKEQEKHKGAEKHETY
jgi:hypothetical protein